MLCLFVDIAKWRTCSYDCQALGAFSAISNKSEPVSSPSHVTRRKIIVPLAAAFTFKNEKFKALIN
jgi:hypothetical protein